MKKGSKRAEEKIRGHIENAPFAEVKGKNLSVVIARGLAVFSRFFFPPFLFNPLL